MRSNVRTSTTEQDEIHAAKPRSSATITTSLHLRPQETSNRGVHEGGDPKAGTPRGEDMEGLEYRLIPFHIQRIKGKRRTKPTDIGEVDYYWTESFWRFHYSVLTDGRPSEAIHRMMYVHLLAQIRLCGPIGLPPRNRDQGERLNRHHLNQRILWLERNSPMFRDEATRAALREYRERNATEYD